MRTTFERIMEDGCSAVRSGRHTVERPPEESGRWGLSVVCRPTGEVLRRIASVTVEVSEIAGESHWRTGATDRAHVTVRTLEPRTADAPPQDRLTRYAAALERSASGPVELCMRGVVLSPAGVMLACTPITRTAAELRARLSRELGEDGWLEGSRNVARDPIWYCTLLHFAGPIHRPDGLIEWVRDRQSLDIGPVRFDRADICEWRRAAGPGMTPVVLASSPLGPTSAPDSVRPTLSSEGTKSASVTRPRGGSRAGRPT